MKQTEGQHAFWTMLSCCLVSVGLDGRSTAAGWKTNPSFRDVTQKSCVHGPLGVGQDRLGWERKLWAHSGCCRSWSRRVVGGLLWLHLGQSQLLVTHLMWIVCTMVRVLKKARRDLARNLEAWPWVLPSAFLSLVWFKRRTQRICTHSFFSVSNALKYNC